ncbi:MAG: DUF58 domain-containing protein [Protaetiibacter sp.]
MNDSTEVRYGRTSTVTGTRTRGSTLTRYATTRTGFAASVEEGRRAATRVGTVLRAGGRWLAETVSPGGWLLVGAAAAGFGAALAWGWTEAWVTAVVASALLVVCVPFLLGRHDYAIRLTLDRDRVIAGSEVTGELEVTNRGARAALPVLLDIPVGAGLVEAHIPLLRADAEHRERITIAATRRGVIPVGPMTISRGDPLGVLRREQAWPEVQTIYVHPVTTPIPSTSAGLMRDLEGAATSTIVDSDLAFHAIRGYLPGDSRRHVHWKSTAKTGRLMVRQYEETRRSRIAVVIDLDATRYASDDEFELAVSAAASLSLQAVRDGREVLITTSAEIPEHSLGIVHSIRELPTLTPRGTLDSMSELDASVLVMPLEQVARMTAQSSPQLSMVFAVTGSLQPVERLRATAVAFPSDVAVVAVRCEPGAEPTLRSARELRVITIGMLHDLGQLIARGAAS